MPVQVPVPTKVGIQAEHAYLFALTEASIQDKVRTRFLDPTLRRDEQVFVWMKELILPPPDPDAAITRDDYAEQGSREPADEAVAAGEVEQRGGPAAVASADEGERLFRRMPTTWPLADVSVTRADIVGRLGGARSRGSLIFRRKRGPALDASIVVGVEGIEACAIFQLDERAARH